MFIIPLIKQRLKSTFSFNTLESVLFKINYIEDSVIIQCEGIEKSKKEIERKESEKIKLSEHSTLTDILIPKIKKTLSFDKINFIYLSMNFNNKSTVAEIYFVKDNQKQMKKITDLKF